MITFNPAPLVVDPSTFDALQPNTWTVDIDRFLTHHPVGEPRRRPGGAPGRGRPAPGPALRGRRQYRVSEDNGLQYVIAEIDHNRDTASKTVTPAVVSLVLVALALLVRLLGAAADQRRNELALGSLRGMSSRQMWIFGLAEPFALLLVAAPLGVLLGYGLAVWLCGIWLVDGIAVTIGTASIVAAAVVWLTAVVATVFTVRGALSEPLSSQLAGVRRPERVQSLGARRQDGGRDRCGRSGRVEPDRLGAFGPEDLRPRAAAAAGRRGRTADHRRHRLAGRLVGSSIGSPTGDHDLRRHPCRQSST